MSEPDNLVLAHLRELRADMNARFQEMDARFDAMDARFDRVERRLEIMRNNGEKALRQFIGPPGDGRAHDGKLPGRPARARASR